MSGSDNHNFAGPLAVALDVAVAAVDKVYYADVSHSWQQSDSPANHPSGYSADRENV